MHYSGRLTISSYILVVCALLIGCGGARSSSAGADARILDCTEPKVHCVGPGQEFNTSGISHVESVFEKAINQSKPGDTVAIKGGIYQHKTDSPTKTFLEVKVSGTAEAPITIESFGGEQATIVGFGFPEGTAGPSVKDEALVQVYGDHIRVRNIELRNSSRYGLIASGSYGLYEYLSIHDNWETNVLIYGREKDIEGNTLRYIESYRSRHGTGIMIQPSAGSPKIVKNTTIENSMSYHNGYQPDGAKVPPVSPIDAVGGGNSDGISSSKVCQESAATLGKLNLCPGTLLKSNIAYHNADDGIDISFGDGGSAVIGNVSFDNGPEGNRGFKVFSDLRGGLTFIDNVAFGNIFGSGRGFETINAVENGYMYHNTSVRNVGHGYRSTLRSGAEIILTNNVGAYNGGSDIFASAGLVETTNWKVETQGDPKFATPTFNTAKVELAPLEGLATIDKHEDIMQQVQVALTPVAGSPLIDKGTFVPGVHCARADDAATPMEETAVCRHWRGSAPDIGAFEHGAPLVTFNP